MGGVAATKCVRLKWKPEEIELEPEEIELAAKTKEEWKKSMCNHIRYIKLLGEKDF